MADGLEHVCMFWYYWTVFHVCWTSSLSTSLQASYLPARFTMVEQLIDDLAAAFPSADNSRDSAGKRADEEPGIHSTRWHAVAI